LGFFESRGKMVKEELKFREAFEIKKIVCRQKNSLVRINLIHRFLLEVFCER